MIRLTKMRVLALVCVAVVLVAFVVAAVLDGEWSVLLLGALVLGVLLLSVWNRRLVLAFRREYRRSSRDLTRRTKSLEARVREMAQEFDKTSRELNSLREFVRARVGVRDPQIAAQFDWLARRAAQQEKTLEQFLSDQEAWRRDSFGAPLEKFVGDQLEWRRENVDEPLRRLLDEQMQFRDDVQQQLSSDATMESLELINRQLSAANFKQQAQLLEQMRRWQIMFGTRKRLLGDTSALLAVYGLSDPKLPSLGDWSMTPRALERVRKEIGAVRPEHLVELGSGQSTKMLAYWAGAATVVTALEHDQRYFELTRAGLNEDGVSQARVYLCPLIDLAIRDATYQWYGNLPALEPIDLLIVDGPPGDAGSLSRYPAFPALADKLAIGGRVILDDTDRGDEQEIVARWSVESWHGKRLRVIETVDTVTVFEVVASEIDEDAARG